MQIDDNMQMKRYTIDLWKQKDVQKTCTSSGVVVYFEKNMVKTKLEKEELITSYFKIRRRVAVASKAYIGELMTP